MLGMVARSFVGFAFDYYTPCPALCRREKNRNRGGLFNERMS
jgi:hypothetical protein